MHEDPPEFDDTDDGDEAEAERRYRAVAELSLRFRRHRRPAQRGQVDAAERAAPAQGQHRQSQAADHASSHPRHPDAAGRSDHFRRHARHPFRRASCDEPSYESRRAVVAGGRRHQPVRGRVVELERRGSARARGAEAAEAPDHSGVEQGRQGDSRASACCRSSRSSTVAPSSSKWCRCRR